MQLEENPQCVCIERKRVNVCTCIRIRVINKTTKLSQKPPRVGIKQEKSRRGLAIGREDWVFATFFLDKYTNSCVVYIMFATTTLVDLSVATSLFSFLARAHYRYIHTIQRRHSRSRTLRASSIFFHSFPSPFNYSIQKLPSSLYLYLRTRSSFPWREFTLLCVCVYAQVYIAGEWGFVYDAANVSEMPLKKFSVLVSALRALILIADWFFWKIRRKDLESYAVMLLMCDDSMYIVYF